MSTFRPRWYLCGAWAADAWLGRQTREHADVDIAVFRDDQRAAFDHLAGWQLIAHDPHVAGDTTEPWDGRPLDLPAHVHARSHDGFNLEVLLNERSGRDWVLSREPRLTLPLRRSARRCGWDSPAVVPEVIGFYKATAYFDNEEMTDRRPRDESDFRTLLPLLSGEQRRWLREAISLVRPGHPWLTQLSP
jgi:hypothetical protein